MNECPTCAREMEVATVDGREAEICRACHGYCPDCHREMEVAPIQGVELEACRHCRGYWFDTGELRRFARNAGADSKDASELEVNITFRERSNPDRRCPDCGDSFLTDGTMEALALHAPLARCEECNGLWIPQIHDVPILGKMATDGEKGPSCLDYVLVGVLRLLTALFP